MAPNTQRVVRLARTFAAVGAAIKQSQTSIGGVGIGLREPHYPYVLQNRPSVPWFEVVSESFMGIEGEASRALPVLTRLREDYPVALHGVSLSIGSIDPLNEDYLIRLKKLAEAIEPAWISDHLCWTGADGYNLHDLLPLPFTKESIQHVVPRVQHVQEFLGRRILLENITSYAAFTFSEMREWEFVSEVLRQSDCLLLLDVNNLYVNATNHGFDPMEYVDGLPADRVAYMHLGGHTKKYGYLHDTHDQPVSGPVWGLYRQTLRRLGPVPTLIEWDHRVPEFSVLAAEAEQAKRIQDDIFQYDTHSSALPAHPPELAAIRAV